MRKRDTPNNSLMGVLIKSKSSAYDNDDYGGGDGSVGYNSQFQYQSSSPSSTIVSNNNNNTHNNNNNNENKKKLSSSFSGSSRTTTYGSSNSPSATPLRSSYENQHQFYSIGGASDDDDRSTSSNSSRIGSMKGANYYNQARSGGNIHDQSTSPWLLNVLQDMLRYIYTAIAPIVGQQTGSSDGRSRSGSVDLSSRVKGEFPQPEISLDHITSNKFEQFKKYAIEKYDMKNEEHEAQLMNLWNLCMNSKKNKSSKKRIELSSRITTQWKELGFQGTNPATDFRGSGILGLENLVYFATEYGEQFQVMFTRTRQTSTSYPFVIAGLNVTMMLHDILGIGMNSKKCKNLIARRKFIELLVSEEDFTNMDGTTIGKKKSNKKKSSSTKRKKRSDDEEEEQEEWSDSSDENEEEDSDSKQIVKEANLLIFEDQSPESEEKQEKDIKTGKGNKKTKKNKKASSKKTKEDVKGLDLKRRKRYPVFHELYVTGFTLLDRQWHRVNASSYFNFPDVLEETRLQMEDLIEARFDCIDDIVKFNKK